MPNKPTRFGFKLWVLTESHIGYTWNFEVYTGQAVDEYPEVGGEETDLKILKQEVDLPALSADVLPLIHSSALGIVA